MTDTTPPPLPTNPNGDEKIWIMLCHLSLFIGVGFVLPLIVYLVKKQEAPLTAAHAQEALNFHLSIIIYMVISFALSFVLIGFLLMPLIIIMAVVCAIIASMKAAEGGFYRYPLTIRLI